MEMQVRRNLPLVKRKDDFNQARDTSGGFQVAQISLD